VDKCNLNEDEVDEDDPPLPSNNLSVVENLNAIINSPCASTAAKKRSKKSDEDSEDVDEKTR